MNQREVANKIIPNTILASVFMTYFLILNIIFYYVNEIILPLKIISTTIMVISIIIFEIAYKKDNGIIAITGIEVLVLSFFSLFINHFVIVTNVSFGMFTLIASYMFAIYYVLKSIVIYTLESKKYLKSLSDIKDIVQNEPIKKEAKKSNNIK